MKKMSLLLALTLLLTAPAAFAAVTTVGQVAMTAPRFSAGGDGVVQYASFSSPEIIEGHELTFAVLTFDEELDARTEIEIWPAIEGDIEPWDVPEVVAAFGRNLWVVDDRTGAFVKFDVTAIVKAWNSGALPDMGFEIRVIAADDGDQDKGGAQVVLGAGASKVTLRYFTHPTLKAEAPGGTHVPKIRPGHDSPVRDGSED